MRRIRNNNVPGNIIHSVTGFTHSFSVCTLLQAQPGTATLCHTVGTTSAHESINSNLLSFLDNMSTTTFHKGTVSTQATFAIYFYITALYQAVVRQLLCNLCYQNKPRFYNCTLKMFILPGTTLS